MKITVTKEEALYIVAALQQHAAGLLAGARRGTEKAAVDRALLLKAAERVQDLADRINEKLEN